MFFLQNLVVFSHVQHQWSKASEWKTRVNQSSILMIFVSTKKVISKIKGENKNDVGKVVTIPIIPFGAKVGWIRTMVAKNIYTPKKYV